MVARTDDVTSVREAKEGKISAIDVGRTKAIISHGHLQDFQATYAMIEESELGLTIDGEAADNIGLGVGDTVRYIPR